MASQTVINRRAPSRIQDHPDPNPLFRPSTCAPLKSRLIRTKNNAKSSQCTHTHEIWGKWWGKRLGNAKNRGESCEWPLSESGLINSINYAQVHYGNTRQTAPVHRIRPAHILRRMQFAGKSESESESEYGAYKSTLECEQRARTKA